MEWTRLQLDTLPVHYTDPPRSCTRPIVAFSRVNSALDTLKSSEVLGVRNDDLASHASASGLHSPDSVARSAVADHPVQTFCRHFASPTTMTFD